MRYANVRRLEIWLSGPKGLERDKFNDAAAELACGGEREAENRKRDSYCDSSEFSIVLYSFLSPPAAFVV